ncbi:MAG: hypothetical protein H7222_12450 [Methylotenera sp.]|nr:hypothetical protein [Oligoflexia bacterium]
MKNPVRKTLFTVLASGMLIGIPGGIPGGMTSSAAAEPPNPFGTDYCSLFFNGTPQAPDLWRDCCVEHDLTFWAGGTLQARKRADLKLEGCVCEAGACEIAKLMYWGVKTGRLWPYKFKRQQWGNAWGTELNYRKLTSEEVHQIYDGLGGLFLPVKDPEGLRERLRAALMKDLVEGTQG